MKARDGVPPEVASALSDFTGRDWVYDEIDAWAASAQMGLLLVGGPGSGKSLLMAELIRRRDDNAVTPTTQALVGWHFCRANNDATILPHRVIGALASHLADVPGYMEALKDSQPTVAAVINSTIVVHGDVESGAVVVGNQVNLVDTSPERQFDCVIRSPLEAMAAHDSLPANLVVIIDGLDEALAITDGARLIRLLARTLAPDGDLPQGLRLILTSRPDERVVSSFPNIRRLALDSTEQSTSDINCYAHQRLTNILDDASTRTLAQRLATAANGNFLYAKYIVDDLIADPALLSSQDPATIPLPEGLADYYARSLDRELANGETWEQRYRPLLGALVVARGTGFTAEDLAGITALPVSQVEDALKRCSPYLIGSDNQPYRIFHQSFRDYLAANNRHTIYPNEAHEAVAEWLTNTGGERAENDLVWHLAGAGNLSALDQQLSPEHLSRKESKLGGSAVVDDLKAGAGAAAHASDLLRNLRWTWTSTEVRRHTIEAVSAEALPLIARISGLDAALKAAASLNDDDLGYESALAELAAQLVDAGRITEAIALTEQPHLPKDATRPLAAVAERLAGRAPELAVRIAEKLPTGQRAGVCGALGAVGGKYIGEAERLAEDDDDAEHALAVAVGRFDLDRAMRIAARVGPRWQQAAGRKMLRNSSTVCADIVIEKADNDPPGAAALLTTFCADGRLTGDDANRAILATALKLGPIDPDGALALLETRGPAGTQVRVQETVRGLVHAAAAAGPVRDGKIPVWHPPTDCFVNHTHDADILIGLRLDGLRATAASRDIAREALLHSAHQIIEERQEFEYTGAGAGALARAVAEVAPERAAEVIERTLAAQETHVVSEADEAKLVVVPALALVDPERALEVAESAVGPYQHRALVQLVGALAPLNIARALAVVDKIPVKYSTTRAALLGTCARFVEPDDTESLSALRIRTPRRGESASFQVLFARVGVSLAARAVDSPEVSEPLIERCAEGLALLPALQDIYTLAQARQLARSAPADALALSQTAQGEHDRMKGAIAVLCAGEFAPSEIAEAVRRYVSPALNTRRYLVGAELEDLVVHVGTTDLEAAISICDEFTAIADPFLPAATRLRELAVARWGAADAVKKLIAACAFAPTPRAVGRMRLIAAFDAQDPSVDEQVLSELATLDPESSRLMRPWALAQVDPEAALAACDSDGEDRLFWQVQVVRRAQRQGISVSMALYRRLADASPFGENYLRQALFDALEAAAAKDPAGTLADLDAHEDFPDTVRTSAYEAFARGAATCDPELALRTLERIRVSNAESATISALARGLDLTVDQIDGGAGFARLLELVDRLTTYVRQNAMLRVIGVLDKCARPQPKLLIQCLASLAARDTDTFDLCLPHVVTAASASQPANLLALVEELDKVHTLVMAE